MSDYSTRFKIIFSTVLILILVIDGSMMVMEENDKNNQNFFIEDIQLNTETDSNFVRIQGEDVQKTIPISENVNMKVGDNEISCDFQSHNGSCKSSNNKTIQCEKLSQINQQEKPSYICSI